MIEYGIHHRGRVIVGPDWACEGDVVFGFHGFGEAVPKIHQRWHLALDVPGLEGDGPILVHILQHDAQVRAGLEQRLRTLVSDWQANGNSRGARWEAGMSEQVCVNCGAPVRVINYALGPEVMHVEPHASWQSERRGTAWRYCRLQVASLEERPPDPVASDEQRHDRGYSWPTVETVNLMLAQLQRDRATAYWGEPPHLGSLDGAEAWLLSLRDWLWSHPPQVPRTQIADIVTQVTRGAQ